MSKSQKVVWTKGMFLMPQHFQAQDSYFEEALHFRSGISNFANWGVSRLGVDEASLVNGFVTLRHCEGIFPDGLSFQAPLVDELPQGRQVDDFYSENRGKHLDVYLAVRQMRPSTQNYKVSSDEHAQGGSFRYTAEATTVVDATLGSDEKTIQLAKKSLRLLFEGETLEGFTTIRIARITRGPAGTFVLAEEFIPPLLDIVASNYLMMLSKRMTELMVAKTTARSLSRRQKTGDLADFTNSEAADFWFLHTLNTHYPVLRHIYAVRRGHPEVLYRAMLSLAGALTTFALNQSVSDLPDYDHSALGESFTELDARIRTLIGFGQQEKYIAAPFVTTRPFVWTATLSDERHLNSSQVLISVSSSNPALEIISKFQKFARAAAPEDINRIIRSQLTGVGISYVPSPPNALPKNLSCHYFSLETTDGLWEQVVKSRTISVFVPGEISDPKMELLTVIG
jgi:type VI secretion system protein ImpJ